MGITWMTRNELAQAIPPAYTHFIGKALMRQLYRINPANICDAHDNSRYLKRLKGEA